MSPEREAIRLRYDQRDRLIRERTQTINRLRSTRPRLGVEEPKTLTAHRALNSLARIVGDQRGVHAAVDALVDDALYAIDDILRIDKRAKEVESVLDPLVRRITPELLEMRGVSVITAAGLVGRSGDLRNCRNADAFAMRSGTAPVPCSSGSRLRNRINVGGNRQLKRLLHSIAILQLRSSDHLGRIYYERKRLEGKDSKAALRCLKRQLASVAFYRLRAAQGRLDLASVG